MNRLLVKCALFAAAIAGGAAMAGLEMHAIIILIVVGLCILVLVIGGSPNVPIDRTLTPWWAGNSGDSGHHGSGPLDWGSTGGGFDGGGGCDGGSGSSG
jgi:uncharacterized membrane protein YgcG